ncbi:hypothetical protein Ade02nite_53250 [Paractinoplanes deccanensis]|uniref:DUF4142 domain-containing protein n=1 Tax=Paractinoplanes deccanensis TaxID=113561 RepID=A0ABQ3Y9K7_9ACTN|nr:DUF4142 domain-containing protein [Actinoplanes deccanensis]GID76684.1 hypothetical protein Ade02nite_53250 [Actinoplanes deccanensis]
MFRTLTALAAVGALLVPAQPVHAAPSSAAVASRPSLQDQAFLIAAHESHLFEIAGGRIAQRRGLTQAVNALGSRFIRDHTVMDRALTATAAELGVALPNQPNAAQRARLAQYEEYDADRFDIVFVLTQLLGHQAAVADGKREVREGSDPRVIKLARDAAPTITAHHHQLIAARLALQP